MISENKNLQAELVKQNAHISKIEQKIEFRRHGGSSTSRFTSELIEAKSIRDRLIGDISREGGSDVDLNAVVAKRSKEVDDLIKATKELTEKNKALSLYVDFLTNQRPKKVFSEITPRPDFNLIGRKMKQERNLEGKLKEAQSVFDSAKTRADNTSPVGKSKRTGELTRARNSLASVKFDVEHFPQLVGFYQLRAEVKYLETVIVERQESLEERQAYYTELENDIALMEKYGFIKIKS